MHTGPTSAVGLEKIKMELELYSAIECQRWQQAGNLLDSNGELLKQLSTKRRLLHMLLVILVPQQK